MLIAEKGPDETVEQAALLGEAASFLIFDFPFSICNLPDGHHLDGTLVIV